MAAGAGARNVITDLQANGVIGDPFYGENERAVQWVGYEDWHYRTVLSVAADLLDHHCVELVCEGLDTLAVLSLNGQEIARTDNMYRLWRFDVKSALKAGENVLDIIFHSPIRTILPKMAELNFVYPAVCDFGEKTSPHVRKAPYQFGWDWGPRLVGCGVWRPIRLEAWNEARIESLQVLTGTLTPKKASVTVNVEIEAATTTDVELTVESAEGAFPPQKRALHLHRGIQTVAVEAEIDQPQWWFPNGYGEQPLYGVRARLNHDNQPIDEKWTRFGLRKLELRQTRDPIGAGFEFVVNDVPIFAKGGNWIPADSFPARVTDERCRSLIESCRDAHMNMLRVWGGGIYETEAFYDLCDEFGILVWQDFMFSCSMYPADASFLENVRREAVDQLKRLRNHPCVALWCGNNEMEWQWKVCGWQNELPEKVWRQYDQLFHHVLPDACAAFDPTRSYWPSSPSSGGQDPDANSPNFGDMHYWDVWHKAEPFENYLKQFPRFMSEYGFQSFPLIESVRQFAEPHEFDIESPTMLLHQKHPRGNPLIREYMLRDYPEPKDFESFLYVSQILQAEGIRIGAEHLRRIRPRCMGSLYWQINDCWPVASWASIDYYGRWKALHYAAKRFYAPLLISPVLREDRVEVYIVSDRTAELSDLLTCELLTFSGERLWSDTRSVTVAPLSSAVCYTIPIGELGDFDRRAAFINCSMQQSAVENVLFFDRPKHLLLPTAAPKIVVEKTPGGFQLTLSSPVLLRHVLLQSFEGVFGDNFFDLIPNVERPVVFLGGEHLSAPEFSKTLTVRSLVDAFAQEQP